MYLAWCFYCFIFSCRFTLQVEACYMQPSVVCSQPITGTVNILTNTCPTYSGNSEITISPSLRPNSRAFTIRTSDPDPEHFGELRYQLIGDTQALRDFNISSTGEVRTTSRFSSSSVAVYNMQIILSDGAALSSCFVPVNIRVVVNRNVEQPTFSNSSSSVTVLEIHSVLNPILTLRVCSTSALFLCFGFRVSMIKLDVRYCPVSDLTLFYLVIGYSLTYHICCAGLSQSCCSVITGLTTLLCIFTTLSTSLDQSWNH